MDLISWKRLAVCSRNVAIYIIRPGSYVTTSWDKRKTYSSCYSPRWITATILTRKNRPIDPDGRLTLFKINPVLKTRCFLFCEYWESSDLFFSRIGKCKYILNSDHCWLLLQLYISSLLPERYSLNGVQWTTKLEIIQVSAALNN